MRFSELATGIPTQSEKEEEVIKNSLPLVFSILQGCGLDKNRHDDYVILEIVAFHWVYHFSTRLEIGDWKPEDIALLFLQILNETYEDNFKERIEMQGNALSGRIRRTYHEKRIFPREKEIHENLKNFLRLNGNFVPKFEIGRTGHMAS